MRASEIIRTLLDVLDQKQSQLSDEPEGYTDTDIKRFKQIIDLADDGSEEQTYANQPNEKTSSIDAVTQDAGADSWQGTKEPEDIRGTTTRIYGDN